MTGFHYNVNGLTRTSSKSRKDLHNIVEPYRDRYQHFQIRHSVNCYINSIPHVDTTNVAVTYRRQNQVPHKHLRILISKVPHFRPYRRVSELPQQTSKRTRTTTIFSVRNVIRKVPNLIILHHFNNVVHSVRARTRRFSNAQFSKHRRSFRAKKVFQ